MFEFMYAKKLKIEKDDLVSLVKDFAKDYYVLFDAMPNGRIEIFVGAKREDVKEQKNE